ncbi:hypothetical protein SCHIN_v1c02910 [Spiroplasma chinense]|uniref:Chromosome partition protein Smc n=1 Tax=Spiroplasma chinense TaxID=216932 RepID=A0A5B9Y323_9MOLU|nr:hypothetical protein [Spiroplasma chinense]QEH61488.1 hypothetical protein SCHIN_v1c02910 [Spiroplasma chinense]
MPKNKKINIKRKVVKTYKLSEKFLHVFDDDFLEYEQITLIPRDCELLDNIYNKGEEIMKRSDRLSFNNGVNKSVESEKSYKMKIENCSQMLEVTKKLYEETKLENKRLVASNEELRAETKEVKSETFKVKINNKRLEASNERLEASNERLEASNERLEASNERLEASNEEMKLEILKLNERLSRLEK